VKRAADTLSIAMVTETYPPEVNGVARTLHVTVEGLRARGHDICLVRPRQSEADRAIDEPGYRELLRPGFRIPRYPQLRMGFPAKGALMAEWRDETPDVVHIATEGPLGSSALAAARALGVPVATDFHTNFDAYSGHYGIGLLERLVMLHLRHMHNRAGCTLVPTEEMAEALKRDGFERLWVVGRGVDSAVFSPAKRSAELRASWGAHEDTPVALCVSRFAPEKNFPLVLEAYRAMRAARPDTKLVLVGDGPLAENLRSQGLGVVLAGRKVNGELSRHYASADLFLYPSLTETFGLVTLEAMASGLAIVAYDYAAARQYLVHGRSALLPARDDRDAFIQHAVALATDLRRARTLGHYARGIAEGLGWDRVVLDFEAALRRTIDEFSAVQESHAAA
jgi:glycosyltransferase involved in cell wall biosynthesis